MLHSRANWMETSPAPCMRGGEGPPLTRVHAVPRLSLWGLTLWGNTLSLFLFEICRSLAASAANFVNLGQKEAPQPPPHSTSCSTLVFLFLSSPFPTSHPPRLQRSQLPTSICLSDCLGRLWYSCRCKMHQYLLHFSTIELSVLFTHFLELVMSEAHWVGTGWALGGLAQPQPACWKV